MSEEEEEIDINIEQKKNEEIIYTERISDRIYCNVITLTECVQVVCTRTDQINEGAKVFTVVNSPDSHEIAIKEIIEGKCPLSIIRPRGRIGNTEYVEVWAVNELEKPEKLLDKIQNIFNRSKKYNTREQINNLILQV